MRVLIPLFCLTLTSCAYFDNQAQEQVEESVSEIITVTSTEDTVESSNEDNSLNLINGLRSRVDAEMGDPNWVPIIPTSPPQYYQAATGSLFDLNEAQDLYNDIKPRAVGDIITVLLDEDTQAQKNASNDTSKSNNLNLQPISLGGEALQINGNSLSYSLTNDNQTSGTITANQSNSISGSITVEVIEVLTNGNLIIRGEKWLKINTGDEYIRLSGTIRPQDITKGNTIASTRISNANIQYSATGAKQDVQEQSWFARFFNVIF